MAKANNKFADAAVAYFLNNIDKINLNDERPPARAKCGQLAIVVDGIMLTQAHDTSDCGCVYYRNYMANMSTRACYVFLRSLRMLCLLCVRTTNGVYHTRYAVCDWYANAIDRCLTQAIDDIKYTTVTTRARGDTDVSALSSAPLE